MNKKKFTTATVEKAVAFYTEQNLDLEQWFRVADTDYLALLSVLDLGLLFQTPPQRLRLLDLGCGTGRFPEMVRTHLPNNGLIIDYDFLDPSDYCLDVMRKSLILPYNPCNALSMGVESLENWGKGADLRYDIIWAIHSLYFFDKLKIPDVIQTLSGLLSQKTGVGLIYIFTRNSFYLKLYNTYNEVFANPSPPYLTAEQFTEAFDNTGLRYIEQLLHFKHQIDRSDHLLLEKYLQKCVLDSTRPLKEWWQHTPLRELVESFLEGDHYRFPQELSVIQFGNIKQAIIKGAKNNYD